MEKQKLLEEVRNLKTITKILLFTYFVFFMFIFFLTFVGITMLPFVQTQTKSMPVINIVPTPNEN